MHFEIVGEIEEVRLIAQGRSIRERARLGMQFGRGRWRKLKGVATIRLRGGAIIGRRKFKIKRFLE